MSSRTRARSALLGFILSAAHGFMFVLGTGPSNLAYLLGVVVLVALGPNALLRRSVLRPLAVCFVVVALVLLSAVIHGLGDSGMGGPSIYFRGCIILLLVSVAVTDEVDTFLRAYNWGSLLALGLATLSLGLFLYLGFSPVALLVQSPGGPQTVFTRFSGLYHNPNYWAIYSLIALWFGLYDLSRNRRTMSGFVALLALANLIATQSRMGLAGLLLMGAGYVSIQIIRGRVLSVRGLALGATAVWLGTVAALLMLSSPRVQSGTLSSAVQETSLRKQYDKTVRLLSRPEDEPRFQSWSQYLEQLGRSPSKVAFGLGLRRFDVATGYAPHNSYLTAFVEFGLMGFFLLVLSTGWMMVLWFVRAAREDDVESTLLLLLVLSCSAMMLANDFVDTRSAWVAAGFLLGIDAPILRRAKEGHTQ